MTIGPDDLGNGSATTQERFAGQLGGYRSAPRRDIGLPTEQGIDGEMAPRNGAAPGLEAPMVMGRPPRLPSLEPDGLAEPVFAPAGWLDGAAGTLADHPLLRGLLLELPPKGAVPAAGWLDRWFEAARSILELLYVQEGARRN